MANTPLRGPGFEDAAPDLASVDKQTNRAFFVEMFQWKDARASDIAHRTPEVMAIWDPMEPLLENLQLSHIEPISLPSAR
ncbi:MAG: hypothetical protein WBN92_21040 [Terriglobia bacterium]